MQIQEINRKLKKFEYDRLVDYAIALGVENGFIQEGETACLTFIPTKPKGQDTLD